MKSNPETDDYTSKAKRDGRGGREEEERSERQEEERSSWLMKESKERERSFGEGGTRRHLKTAREFLLHALPQSDRVRVCRVRALRPNGGMESPRMAQTGNLLHQAQ